MKENATNYTLLSQKNIKKFWYKGIETINVATRFFFIFHLLPQMKKNSRQIIS